jgi:hypothetical protein
MDAEIIFERRSSMKINQLLESLNQQQRSVPQLPAQFRPKKISVLNNPTDPRHPMTGYAVGANESISSKDPYDQGWRTGHRHGQDETACPYKSGTAEHAQWMAGYEEAKAQPGHYDESLSEDDVEDFLSRGGKITQVKPNRGPRSPGTSLGSKHIGTIRGGRASSISGKSANTRPTVKPVVAVEADVEEGWKQKVAGAALAGAAALGAGGAQAQTTDKFDPAWGTSGYDNHIRSDRSLTRTMGSDPSKDVNDFQSRIQNVIGPNAKGEYKVIVIQGNDIVSHYITKTPPPGWIFKEDITKEDIITKLKARLGDYLSDLSKEIKKDPDLIDKLAAKAPGDQMGPPVKTVTTDDGHEISIHGNEDDGFRVSIKNKTANSKFKNLDEAVMACEMYCARRRSSQDYLDEAGKDACYSKVKSRYKIWPSAYASGALVRCRKVGAANWGNKSKK